LDEPQTPFKCDSLNWDDLRQLRKKWSGPLVVKGILRADDALRAHECGADAIVVSNHGGRNLDASVPPFTVLPEIVDTLGKRMDVWVDGGMNRGSDVVKAIAMGAKGALVGRGPLWGVACDGEPGARLALQIYKDEMGRVMAYVGASSVAALDRDLLYLA
jgi:isopentenyl diphosphate isomerase/L-lactate dehydrogenase-like FMN-dependent dehydrogenase